MVKWDTLWPGGLTFAFDDGPFKPSTDTFLLGGFAAPRPRDRVCDLGAGIGLLGLLLLGRQPSIRVTDIDIDPAACALAVMPLEYKIATLALVIIRYVVVALEVRRVARRLGESGIMGRYFIYDLLSPLWAAALWVMLLRRDDRVWR